MHDLLGILVNNPADFPRHLKPEDAAALIKIHPIPLQPTLMREPSLHTDLVIIAHFPCGEGHRAECVELALGRKYNGVSVCQGKLQSGAAAEVAAMIRPSLWFKGDFS